MTISICCLVFSLLSANLSDLRQTAYFTAHRTGSEEATLFPGPIRPAVQRAMNGASSRGEFVSGTLAMAGALALEARNTRTSQAVLLAWTAAHVWAVTSNYKKDHAGRDFVIMAPVFAVQW